MEMQVEGNLVSDDDEDYQEESSGCEPKSLEMDQELEARRKASGKSISKLKKRA